MIFTIHVTKRNRLKNREPPAWLLFPRFTDIMIKKRERERVDDAET